MSEIITTEAAYTKQWQAQQAHVLQSWQWGELRKQSKVWTPLRWQIADQVITVFSRKLPAGKIGYIPRLALLNGDFAQLITEMKTLAQAQGLGLVLIDPNWSKHQVVLPGNLKRGHQIQPQHTNQIMLTSKSEEDLWMGMKGNYRRNINKSKRSGVRIEAFDFQSDYRDDALINFYNLMRQVAGNTDFILVQQGYFENLWQTLGSSQMAKIYLAYESENNVVGAYLVVFDEVGAYELYGGVNSAGRAVEAGYLLKWEAILDARKLGKAFYDHWGIAPFQSIDEVTIYDKSHPLAKISEFKAGFGGNLIEFEDQLTLVINPLINSEYRLLDFAKTILLKFKKL